MRFAFFFFFSLLYGAGSVGCGGHVAADDSDASTDSSTHDSGVVVFDARVSDSSGPPSDVLPPRTCPLLDDPCFARFAAEVANAAACMAHPDTCVATGGTDATGCGHRSGDPSHGTTCSWPDGARTSDDPTGGYATNAGGAACYKYTLARTSSGADVTVSFPDGAVYVEHLTTSGGSSTLQSIGCPDGSRSRTFTTDEANACNIAVVCCSSNVPPTCSG